MGIFSRWFATSEKELICGLPREKVEDIILAADQEEPSARQALLELFDRGFTSEEHNKMRLSLYKPLAEQGNAVAQRWMGTLSATDSDAKQSCYWYNKAAEQGDIESINKLAWGYSDVLNDVTGAYHPGFAFGFRPDLELFWLTKAAELGDPEAQCNLAQKYLSANYVERNIEQAVYWFSEACNQQYARAFLDMGKLYDSPYASDIEKARSFFRQAVDMGNREVAIEAAWRLGMYYGAGYVYGAPPKPHYDANESLYWLSQAYILGDDSRKEDINKLCAATGLQIPDGIWTQWVEEAKQRIRY